MPENTTFGVSAEDTGPALKQHTAPEMSGLHPARVLALVAGAFVVAQVGFHFANWGHGVIRAFLALLLLASVLSMPRWVRVFHIQRCPNAPELRPMKRALVLLFVLELGLGVFSTVHTARTGRIVLDQGQNTYRSALLLMRGENPYAYGQLLDLEAYTTRRNEREQAGVLPLIGTEKLNEVVDRYWETLDPQLLRSLLPLPGPDASPEARREVAILGYKYGPLVFTLSALPVRMFGPAAIPLLNLGAYTAWALALAAVLKSSPLPRWSLAIAFIGVLLGYHVPVDFLLATASDIWPLLFTTVAVLAVYQKWPVVLGLALGLALASKLFPSLLFVPLLLLARSWRATIVAAIVAAAAYVPFILSDPSGVYYNVLRWSSLMRPDTTGWVYFSPIAVVVVGRAAVAIGIIVIWFRLLSGREQRLFSAICAMNLLLVLGGVAFHNNYITWFAPWLFLAAAEAISQTPALPPRNPVAIDSEMPR